ncbi:MAG: methionine--tRNA ligase subunit beta, partial [Planctomycetota bacterium]
DALNLKNPICKLCGNAPIVKETEHWYLDLPKLHEDGLGKWFEGNDNERKHVDWKPNVKSFVANMLKDLHDRPITRNLRWGVPLPKEYNAPEDKVLYVWFDAPIGYCSMTQELLEKRGAKDKNAWCEWWAGGEETKVLHFIGKDNIGFHTIVFPAMLFGQKTKFGKKMNLPWAVPAMEFYNLQGRKFSTSDGWTIDPKEFLQKFPNVDALRFTLLATAPETSDSEFSFEEYQKINNELANNIGNLLSRTAKFAREKLGGNISKPAIQSLDESTNAILCGTEGIIPKLALWNIGLESFQFRAACSAVLSFATKVNIYFDAQAPWKLIQLNEQATKDVIYWTCVLLEVISIIIEPFAPSKANEIRRVLGADSAGRERLRSTLLNAGAVNLSPDISEFSISEPPILFPKLDEKVITAEIESLKSKSKKLETTNKPMEPTPAPATPPPTTAPAAAVPTDPNAPKAEITYDDFMKCEFRIGTVIAAERVEKADKLLKLQVDIGREKRQVVAGIASKYTPEELVGKRVVVVCNLAPRKLRGAESQGMILAADDGSGPIVITPSADVKNGATVK